MKHDQPGLEPDRTPANWVEREDLAQSARAVTDDLVIGRFVTAHGIDMAVAKIGQWPLEGQLDATDNAMVLQGYGTLMRVVAFGEGDRRVYAVWEVYGRDDDHLRLRSKAVDVDAAHLHQGIGTGIRRSLMELGHSIEPSGSATRLGTLFIASWRGPQAIAGRENDDAE